MIGEEEEGNELRDPVWLCRYCSCKPVNTEADREVSETGGDAGG